MTHVAAQSLADNRTTGRNPAGTAGSGRADAAFRSANKHSARVRLLKFILPLAALLIVCGFAVRSWMSVPDGLSVNLAGTAIENGRLVMADPKLDGFTKDNRAYTMTAVKAIQDIGDASRIDLEGIKAKLPFNTSNWLTVDAATGLYDREANQLNLGKAITVVTDNGVRAMLTSATVHIGGGDIKSNEPVDIVLDGARLQADSMTIKDNGAIVIFDQRVRMNIDPKRMQTAASEGNQTNEN